MTNRLLSNESDICSIQDLILRLVSNNTIDKNKVPKHLYNICASIFLNDNDEDVDEDSPITRTLTIDLLKEHRIVISTCGGIAILQDKSVLFTHIFIDEASQCQGKNIFHIENKKS